MKRIVASLLTLIFVAFTSANADSIYNLQPGEVQVSLSTELVPSVTQYLVDLNKKEGEAFVLQGMFQYAGDQIAIAGNGETAPSCCKSLLILQVKNESVNKIRQLDVYNCEVVRTKSGDIKIVGYSNAKADVHLLKKNSKGIFTLR